MTFSFPKDSTRKVYDDEFDSRTYTKLTDSSSNDDEIDIDLLDFTFGSTKTDKMSEKKHIKTEKWDDRLLSDQPVAAPRTSTLSQVSADQFTQDLQHHSLPDSSTQDIMDEELEEMYVRITVRLMNKVPSNKKIRLMVDFLQVLDHHINGPRYIHEQITEQV